MTKSNVLRKILNAIVVFSLIVLIWGNYLSGFALFSRIHYNYLTSDMNSVEATVVNVTGSTRMSLGSSIRWVSITYEVDGVTYNSKLSMIVRRLFKMSDDIYYSGGDKIIIFYESDNPAEIEFPNSSEREDLYSLICIGAFSLAKVIGLILDKFESSADSKKQKAEQIN